jgi:CRP/FNR family cyclic AMP-dependent transcriptional regulator
MEHHGLTEVPVRLANITLLLIESEGVRTRTHFNIPTSSWGTMIGANREAVTRAFNRLREAGCT